MIWPFSVGQFNAPRAVWRRAMVDSRLRCCRSHQLAEFRTLASS
jgi:hypothetical protein